MTPATPTELCNVALGHIGQARIADIGERSPAAEHCRRMFDHVRRLCLRDHDWNFAIGRESLTALSTPPPFGFSAAYQLPADCLRVLAINGQPAGVRGTQWEVEGRTVLINADAAQLRYIRDADDVTQWDSIFQSYFSYRLAAAVAPSFRIDPQAGLQLEQMAAAVRASAQEADNVETAPRVTRLDQSEIIQERGGRWRSGTTGTTGGSTIGWGTIAVSGQSNVVATVAGDILTFEAGSNITLTTNPTTKKVTIAATGGGGGGGGSVTLTGDVTGTGTGTVATTIADGAITTAKIADAQVTVAKTTGFGTIATQNANGVTITGGSVTGITDLAIADGGTGASTAANALTNLGAYPASNPSGFTSNTGTVTAVTIATANGISGTSSGGATPALTITLGAITPSSVNGVTFTNGGSGALTVTGTASIAGASSGTNTGDQTITLTGDVTGSGTGSFAATIAASAVTAGKIASNAVTTAKLDAEAVTYAKIQSLSAASQLLGRGTTGGTLVREIGIGAGLTMSGDTLSASGSGDVTGPASSTANAIARFSGTGGKTLLNSAIVIDEIDATTQQNVAIRNVDPATNSAFVITPKGTGALIFGPKPDGSATGGNARGVSAVDLQRNRNSQSQVASGESSAILCGAQNSSTNFYAAVINGLANTASANSAAAGGQSCTASGTSSIAFGQTSTASATAAQAWGSRSMANRIGMAALANGQFSATGDAQAGRVVMRRQTTDATPANLSLDGAAPTGSTITTSTHFILLNSQAVFADIRVVARSTSGTDHAAYMRRALIKRDANAASTAIIGTVLSPTADIESAGATAWDVAITADTTNGGMLITVTGAASTTINWTAEVSFVETIRA